MHVGHAVDQRVDIDRADTVAVQARLGIDIDPAQVDAQCAAVAERVVHACMQCQAPGIVQLQRAAGQRAAGIGAEEARVVDTGANERRERALGVEVVLQ